MEDRFFILVIVHQRALHQPLIEVFFEFRNYCKAFADVFWGYFSIFNLTEPKSRIYLTPKQPLCRWWFRGRVHPVEDKSKDLLLPVPWGPVLQRAGHPQQQTTWPVLQGPSDPQHQVSLSVSSYSLSPEDQSYKELVTPNSRPPDQSFRALVTLNTRWV